MWFCRFGVGPEEFGDDGEAEKSLPVVVVVSPSLFRESNIPSISRSAAFSLLVLLLLMLLFLLLLLSILSRQRGSNWRLTPANSEELVDDADEGVLVFLLLVFVLLRVLLLVLLLPLVPVPILVPLVPVPGGCGDLYI